MIYIGNSIKTKKVYLSTPVSMKKKTQGRSNLFFLFNLPPTVDFHFRYCQLMIDHYRNIYV